MSRYDHKDLLNIMLDGESLSAYHVCREGRMGQSHILNILQLEMPLSLLANHTANEVVKLLFAPTHACESCLT